MFPTVKVEVKSCTTWCLQHFTNQQLPLTEQMVSEVGLLYFCITHATDIGYHDVSILRLINCGYQTESTQS